MAVSERAVPLHNAVQEGGGVEVTALGGGGGKKVTPRAFNTYGCLLEMVTYFKYLGRVILAADNN